jgi:hypothetical protein
MIACAAALTPFAAGRARWYSPRVANAWRADGRITVTNAGIAFRIFLALTAAFAAGSAQAQAANPIETTTPAGEKILLHPDGRWEYADPAKRAASPPTPAAAPATAAATATPTAAAGRCPPDAQGHLFMIGRCVMPGDKDYNRGSLSGKGR